MSLLPEENVLGMTGTRDGMTEAQKTTCLKLFLEFKPDIYIHGCCQGADQDFHHLIIKTTLGKKCPQIEGYPASIWQEQWAADQQFHHLHKGYTYKERDLIIATRSKWFLGFPRGYEEELRSGTWMTLRMRRKLNKSFIIVLPNGTPTTAF